MSAKISKWGWMISEGAFSWNMEEAMITTYSSNNKRQKWAGMGLKVLYMSFDKFLLAVESRDLSQADKSITRVSSFPEAVFEW